MFFLVRALMGWVFGHLDFFSGVLMGVSLMRRCGIPPMWRSGRHVGVVLYLLGPDGRSATSGGQRGHGRNHADGVPPAVPHFVLPKEILWGTS